MTRLRLAFAVLLAVAGPALAQSAGGTAGYTIGGIAVDVSAKTPDDARAGAYREAQRRAWPLLWARLTGTPAASAPRLTDGALDAMVSGIEIQGERFSTTRYIATLGVVFDRNRASDYFGGTSGALRSEPMLLLPVMTDAGVRTIYQQKTPWVQAWLDFREAVSPLDYVLASGSPGDNVLLTGYQPRRTDRALWRNILNRFQTVDVLTAEVVLRREFPGGPVEARFFARHGPDGTLLGQFALRASDASGVEALLKQGAERIDAIYATALREGRLRSEVDLTAELAPISGTGTLIGMPDIAVAALPGLGGAVEALVITPDAATWLAVETALRGTPGVTGVTLTSLSLGGASRIVVRHADSRAALDYALDQRGLRLVAAEGGGVLLRRNAAGDVPIAAPAVVAPPAPAADAPADFVPAPATTAEPPPPRDGGPVDLLPPGNPG